MRRRVPVVVVAVGLLLLLAWYVSYTQRVRTELAKEAAATSALYARVYRALADTTSGAGDVALTELAASILERGVPIIVTDRTGKITDVANLPIDASGPDGRIAEYLKWLDRQNAAIVLPDERRIHFGHTPFVDQMRVVPLVQVGLLAVLLLAGVAVSRSRSRADREELWAGMARESAHQMGTPLSSLSGWLELLRAREDDPVVSKALPHMQSDIGRLERVSHRFERIGRPPRRDPVDLAAVAANVVGYFAARVPTLAHPIALRAENGVAPLQVPGDLVLLEWAVESLVKNAIDALAGRGGTIVVRVDAQARGGARVRISDDGPGVPRELRSRIFSAGFTTKERGWGLGLALARRIVEENHHGRLALVPSDRGAVFDIILPG